MLKRCMFSLLILQLCLGAWTSGTALSQEPAEGQDFDIPGGHFYKQANGQGGAGETGYAITDDAAAPLWSEFQRLGGVEAVGYPASRRFVWNGFISQVTQKEVLQWRPDTGQTSFVNVFDELTNSGKDDWLLSTRQVPRPLDNSGDAGLSWDAVVQRHGDLLDQDQAIKTRYLSEVNWLDLYGLPMSFADYGDVFVVRAQRAVFQHWKADVPWAKAGDVIIANGGDIAKEAGILPAEALTPELPPGGAPDVQTGDQVSTQPESGRPNIIFITIDALSTRHLGAYGNSRVKTPVLDSLAQRGVRFNQEISSFSQTNPSVASIFTGVYPARHGVGVQGQDILRPLPTLASVLAENGYETAAIYSTRSLDADISGLGRGFRTYQPAYAPDPGQFDKWRLFRGHADLTTNAAVSWLKQQPGSPFFLWLFYEDPHYPFEPPAPFDTMYDACDTCVDGSYNTIDRITAGERLPDRDIAHLQALYDGDVSFTDREVGKLLEAAGELGKLDNTMVIVTADHGEALGENGLWLHPDVFFDTVIRVPLIISYPGAVPQGVVVDSVTRNIDILPTILDVVGISAPQGIEGTSLWPLIGGQEPPGQRTAFVQGLFDKFITVVTGEWKLIRNNSTGGLLLFNLKSDPNELNNLAHSNPGKASELEQLAKEFMAARDIGY